MAGHTPKMTCYGQLRDRNSLNHMIPNCGGNGVRYHNANKIKLFIISYLIRREQIVFQSKTIFVHANLKELIDQRTVLKSLFINQAPQC